MTFNEGLRWFGAVVASLAFVPVFGAGTAVDIPVGASTEAILAAIGKAEEGGIIRFPAGTWTVTNTLVLAKGVTVAGAGPDKTVLDFGLACRGFELFHESAKVEGLKVFRARAYAENTSVGGGGIHMADGLVTNCLIEACNVDGTVGKLYFGGGVYMSGGRLSGCEITGCTVSNLYGFGNALFVKGGTADDCDIHNNDGGYSHPSVQYGGAVVFLENGMLENSRVHHNTKESNPGVHLNNRSIIRNCLVYANRGDYGSGGIYMSANFSGLVDYCTVYGNVMTEVPGRAGLRCTGGTVKNSIFWANGPAGGCQVASGCKAEIFNNVFDRGLGDYPNNRVSDPKFRDPENGDFTIASRASPACGYALPDEAVTRDLAGSARNATAPTCGAYEYDPSNETFGADIVFSQTSYGVGSDVTVRAVVTGANPSDVEICWYVDDRKLRDRGYEQVIRGLSVGRHSVGLKVSQKKGGELVIKDYTDYINVLPTVCYVNTSGSAEFPFDTPEKGTTSLDDAMDALWTAPNITSVVHVAAGAYNVKDTVMIKDKVHIIGEGRDEVSFFCPGITTFLLVNSEAEVSGITVNGGHGAFELTGGRVSNCRAQNVMTTRHNIGGAGYRAYGGEIVDCEAINCAAVGTSSGGGGLFIHGRVSVSNLLLKGCCGFEGMSGCGAIRAEGGFLRNVTITGSHMQNAIGCAIQAWWTDLENCVITGCTAGVGQMLDLNGVTARNLLVTDCSVAGTKFPAFGFLGGTYENCRFERISSPATCFWASNTVFRCTDFSGCAGTNAFLGTTRLIDCAGVK